jgi:hypothetical protein
MSSAPSRRKPANRRTLEQVLKTVGRRTGGGGISFNDLLARFFRSVGRVDGERVNSFLDDFGLRGVALENLRQLRSKRIAIPGVSKMVGGT